MIRRKTIYQCRLFFVLVITFFIVTAHRAAAQPAEDYLVLIYAPLAGIEDDFLAYVNNLQNAVVKSPGVEIRAMVGLPASDSRQETVYLSVSPEFENPRTVPLGPQSFSDGDLLADFIKFERTNHPNKRIILIIEGHGLGYIPDTRGAPLAVSTEPDPDELTLFSPVTIGSGINLPYLPMTSTVLNDGVISTFELGTALAVATDNGQDPLALVVFNNCFNFSMEILDTIAPFVDYTVGYANYTFYTAGETYEKVFESISAETPVHEVANAFAHENQNYLGANPGHPTIGGAIDLKRLPAIRQAVNVLAAELIAVLPTDRARIDDAINSAQQYDTSSCDGNGDFNLNGEDSMSDLRDLAGSLMAEYAEDPEDPVFNAASELYTALRSVKVYGEVGSPWMAPQKVWDFTPDSLSMNIFLPRLRSSGATTYTDWRAAYQMTPFQEQNRLAFYEDTLWDEFVVALYTNTSIDGFTTCTTTTISQAVPVELPSQ